MKILTSGHTKDDFRRPKNTVWLQGVGWTYGKPAGELQVGDAMVWNYGSISKVVAIMKQTDKTITVTEEYYSYPSEQESYMNRTMKKDRIVGIAKP